MRQSKKSLMLLIFLAGRIQSWQVKHRLAELCELLNAYVEVDDSVHLILARIVKNNNPNVNKDKKSDFINVLLLALYLVVLSECH